MRTRAWLVILVMVAFAAPVTACGDDDDGASGALTEPSGGTDAGDAGDSGDGDGLCALFTTKEIEDALGASVEKGSPAGPGGTACQWDGKTDTEATYVQIQVVDADYWEVPSMGEDYEERPEIGEEGFVIPEMGGFKAGALAGDQAVFASLAGGSATKDSTVAFLQEVLTRI